MFKIAIKTTQNIPLYFTPASVGERIFAFFIDQIISTSYILFLYILGVFDFLNNITADSSEYLTLLLIVLSPYFLYPFLCESFMSGQTFGKKIMKIKVLKIDGYQASFSDFFIRWIIGLLEKNVVVIGLISIIFSKYSQRLGDFVAGTAVVSLKNKTQISHTILVDVEQEYKPYFSKIQIFLFSEKDVQIIKNYYDKALKNNDYKLIGNICKKIEEVSKTERNQILPTKYIELFLKDYNFYNSTDFQN